MRQGKKLFVVATVGALATGTLVGHDCLPGGDRVPHAVQAQGSGDASSSEYDDDQT